MACLSCRKRKIRCSSNRPSCSNCTLYGTTCEYPPPRLHGVTASNQGSSWKAEAWMQHAFNQRNSVGWNGIAEPAVSHGEPPALNPMPFAAELRPGTMPSESASYMDSDSDFFTGTTASAFGQMKASQLLNPEPFSSRDLLQPAVDATAFFSILDEERWRATAGALWVDSAGVNLHGMHACSPITPALPLPSSLARVHPFVPLLPVELAIVLLNGASDLAAATPTLVSTQILASPTLCARAFASFALLSLAKAAEPIVDDKTAGLSLDLEFVTAQQLAASAYRNAIERVTFDFSGTGVSWVDDRVMTVAGFVYLAVRSIFTNGWNAEACTLLDQAVNVLLTLPTGSVVRAWSSRIIFLWDLGLNLACSPVGPLCSRRVVIGALEAEVVMLHQQLQHHYRTFTTSTDDDDEASLPYRSTSLASYLPFIADDPDACVFDSLVTLAMELHMELGPNPHSLERLAKIQLWLNGLPFELRSEVLDVVVLPAGWEHYTPVAVFSSSQPPSSLPNVASGDAATHSSSSAMVATRSALARIIRVLYFALTMSCYHRVREAVWLDLLTADSGSRMFLRTQTSATGSLPAAPPSSSPLAGVSVRETSLRAAMININEAADHLIHHKLVWLWPFTEQMIWFAQRVGLGAFGCGLEMWFQGLGHTASGLHPAGDTVDHPLSAPLSSEEASLQAVVQAASQITPDGPHQSILCIIHAVLCRAHTAFTHVPSAARHLPSVRLLSAVAAAASVRAPELTGEGVDGTQVPHDLRREAQRQDGMLGPSVFVGGSRREIAGGAAMSRALAGRRR